MIILTNLGADVALAGLYYSEETYAELPSQWRGFLLDQRALRQVAVKPGPMVDASPLRLKYQEEVKKLEAKAGKEKLTANEIADLGALHIRLGDVGAAVDVLRKGQREFPNHFYINANLGTAWQLQGELTQAIACLEIAVKLAPGRKTEAEEYHLKLVRDRLRRGKMQGQLDNLFGVTYTDDKLAEAELKKLPTHALAVTQQLALWLPADGRLLWQLGELAHAYGDIKQAASLLEGCVTQFGMNNPELRRHYQHLKAVAEKLPKAKIGDTGEHAPEHQSKIAFRSRRPLSSRFLALPLPPIDPTGINHVPWEVFNETQVEGTFKPRFSKYLQELEKKQVALTGFMFPLREDLEFEAFLFLEFPVGCWYCEMPETSGIVFVQLKKGEKTAYQRGLMRVIGTLTLNRTDPEDFFYTLKDARITGID